MCNVYKISIQVNMDDPIFWTKPSLIFFPQTFCHVIFQGFSGTLYLDRFRIMNLIINQDTLFLNIYKILIQREETESNKVSGEMHGQSIQFSSKFLIILVTDDSSSCQVGT